MKSSLKQWKNNLKRKNYDLFLKSKYWKEVKTKVLCRDKNKCRYCGSVLNLEVHHLTYKNHYKEHKNLADLITLCRICHQSEHDFDKKKNTIK